MRVSSRGGTAPAGPALMISALNAGRIQLLNEISVTSRSSHEHLFYPCNYLLHNATLMNSRLVFTLST